IARRPEVAGDLALSVAPEVREEVDDLAALELGYIEAHPANGRHHGGAVVPLVVGGPERRGPPRKLVEPRAGGAALPPQAVALDAVLLGEEDLPDPRVPRLVEVVEEEDERQEVRQLVLLEGGTNQAKLLHLFVHDERVVPHGGRELEERALHRRAAEIGADAAPRPAAGVALDASLGHEKGLAPHRIPELRLCHWGRDERDGEREQSGNSQAAT